jgi:plastocyanin
MPLSLKKIDSRKSISAILPVFVVVALVLVILAGYYVATVLPGSLPTSSTATVPSYTSTVTGNLTSTGVNYVPIHSKMVNFTTIYIQDGASIDAVPAFNPNPATVVIGTNNTVEWRNADSAVQNVVISALGVTSTNMTALFGSFTYVFTTPGTYSYSSSLHPFENGTITVVQ